MKHRRGREMNKTENKLELQKSTKEWLQRQCLDIYKQIQDIMSKYKERVQDTFNNQME